MAETVYLGDKKWLNLTSGTIYNIVFSQDVREVTMLQCGAGTIFFRSDGKDAEVDDQECNFIDDTSNRGWDFTFIPKRIDGISIVATNDTIIQFAMGR